MPLVQIHPYHLTLSRRSPVASFRVRTPRDHVFEIVLASDPAVYARPRLRTRRNFYTSRELGWLHAPSGETTFVLAAEALGRFVGARRLHYLLAAYSRGADACAFSAALEPPDDIPALSILPDLNARVFELAARRGRAEARPVLSWGGDRLRARWRRAQGLDDMDFEESSDPDFDDRPPPPPHVSLSPLATGQVLVVEVRGATGAVDARTHEYPIDGAGLLRVPGLRAFEARGLTMQEVADALRGGLRGFTVNLVLSPTQVTYDKTPKAGETLYLRALDPTGAAGPASGAYIIDAAERVDLPLAGVLEVKDKSLAQLETELLALAARRPGGPWTVHLSDVELDPAPPA